MELRPPSRRTSRLFRVLATPARLRTWLLKQPVFTSKILPALPRRVRWTLRRFYFLLLELADRILGQREEMTPPMTQIFTGSAEGFRRSGETLVQRLVDLADLAPESKLLDVGSGNGRLPVALTRFLDANGLYVGLDIVPSGIKWCTENISSKHPNFSFTLADIYNSEYHPKGRFKASEYKFPFSDETFDLVVLVSVFTHMLPPDMENYVAEISRVLKRNGRCFATYFLINEESRRLMSSGAGSLIFTNDLGVYWTVSKRSPEFGVGYDETYVRELFDKRGLFGEKEIYYGGWCGREPFWSKESGLGDQDVVVATKQ
jgi:SAM-dependent methyltransferase